MASDTVPINGFAVRALRRARRLSQQKVAVLAEISPSYLSELESSVKVNVSLEVFQRLVFALDLDPEDERALTRWWTVEECDSAVPA